MSYIIQSRHTSHPYQLVSIAEQRRLPARMPEQNPASGKLTRRCKRNKSCHHLLGIYGVQKKTLRTRCPLNCDPRHSRDLAVSGAKGNITHAHILCRHWIFNAHKSRSRRHTFKDPRGLLRRILADTNAAHFGVVTRQTQPHQKTCMRKRTAG